MKIAYLLTQSLDSPSGLGRYWPMATEMARRGHQVDIFALHPNYKSLTSKNERRQGVEIHYVAPMHVKKSASEKTYYSPLKFLLVSLNATWKLTRAVIKSEADMVHICKPHPMNSLAGIAGKCLRRKELFLDCDDYEAASGTFSSKWQKSTVAAFEKRIPHRVRMITTNTIFMQDKLQTWGVPAKQIYYLPNGVDRERFIMPEKEPVNTFRVNLGLVDKKVISYIGSMSLANHAVDLVIDAFPLIKSVLPDSVLLLVGGGEDYQDLQALAVNKQLGDDIKFVGHVAPDDVPSYYALSDITLDPVHDNDAARGRSPLKLFESWASGVPFITSAVGDRGQLMGDPPAGVLCKPGDSASLADAVINLLGDEEISTDIITLGTHKVEAYYWDRLADGIEHVYQSAIETENL